MEKGVTPQTFPCIHEAWQERVCIMTRSRVREAHAEHNQTLFWGKFDAIETRESLTWRGVSYSSLPFYYIRSHPHIYHY